MTGALDKRRRRRHEHHHEAGRRSRPSSTPRGQQSLLKRLGNTAVGLDPRRAGRHRRLLLRRGRQQVPLRRQLLADLPERRRLGGARRRHDVRHHHLRASTCRSGRCWCSPASSRPRSWRPWAAQGWGTALVGLLVALVSGVVWGILNGFLVAKAKIPALIVTLGTLSVALGLAQVITGGIDVRSVPEAMTDFNTYVKILGIPALPLHRPDRRDHRRHRAAQDQVRPLHLRHRLQRGGGPPRRHQGRPAPDPDLRAVRDCSPGSQALLSLAQFGTTTIAGQSLTNLNVIAAVVIGGTSIFGGEGSIFGTVVGLFIPAVLQAGFVIIGVQPFWQGVAVGTVLVAAVYVDQSRRAAALRGARLNQPSARHAAPEQVKGQFPVNRSSAMKSAGVIAITGARRSSVARPASPRPRRHRRLERRRVRRARTADDASRLAAKANEGPTTSRSSRASPGDEFYITMQCGVEAEAAKLGVTVNTQGPQKFDPTLQKPIVDSVVASKPDAMLIAPTDVTAMQTPLAAGRRAGHQGRPGRHHAERPVVRGLRDRLRQRGRRQGGLRRDQAAQPRRRQGHGHVDRSRHLHHRRPRQGLRGGAVKADPKFNYVGVQYSPQRPGDRGPADSARRCRRTPTWWASSPPTCSPPRARRPACARPASRAGRDRRLRRRAQPGQGAEGGHRPGAGRPAARDHRPVRRRRGRRPRSTASPLPKRSRPGSPSSPRTTSTARGPGDLQVHVLNAPLWGRLSTPAPRSGNGTEVEDQCL